MIDFPSEKYSGSTGHRNSWYQWRNWQRGCQRSGSNSQNLDYKPTALAIELYGSSYCWERVEIIQLVYCIIIYLSFLNCDWLLIREVQWFYWTQKLLVPVEKLTVRMTKVRFELATPGLQTQSSSHWAIQLKSYCCEGVEFIQLVYCVIIFVSFLNCDWLFIREVQWYYWTQTLLVLVMKFTVRMTKVRLELGSPGLQTQCSSHWAIQLKSYCFERVEFIQLVYCNIIYLSLLNCDWLPIREYSASTGYRNSWYQ